MTTLSRALLALARWAIRAARRINPGIIRHTVVNRHKPVLTREQLATLDKILRDQ